jgi:Ni/Co efflux regulator RcnB
MDHRMLNARGLAFALIAASAMMANASGAAQKAAEKKVEKPAQESPQAAPTPGNTMGYGVKLGGFFDDKHKAAAKRSFAQHFARNKSCPKDMEREGKTCRALVKGHYWAVGQPLQKAVEPFPVPDDVKAALPPAPEGYEYVRAGEDILLMSKGIHLVVDVMQDVVG